MNREEHEFMQNPRLRSAAQNSRTRFRKVKSARCPNLIVRDRLEDDFEGGKVFKDPDLLPESAASSGLDNFDLTTLGSGKDGGWSSLFSASVLLGNIHQFYQSNKAGQSNLAGLMNGPEFVLFNDEARNSPASALGERHRNRYRRVGNERNPDRNHSRRLLGSSPRVSERQV